MSKKILSLLAALILCLFSVSALAASSSAEVDGTVVNISPLPVTVSYTGMVAELNVPEGSYVNKGDVIAVLATTKVYASEDGTVRLFGEPGDSTAVVTAHYGAVAYIEPDVAYTIAASTRNAYDAEANKIIHPGEPVYLRGTNTLTHVGTGMVTNVSGTSFNVDVLEGNFESGETVSVFRDEAYTASERIGRGTVSRCEYTAYEGSGIIVSFPAGNNTKVSKGDVLFETIEGEFAGYGTDLTLIRAPETGVITGLTLSAGSAVTAGDTLCVLYPDSGMRVEASVNEEFLSVLREGTPVTVHFTFIGDGETVLPGTVESVSFVGEADAESESTEAFYNAVIALDDITAVKYGMNVTVTD